MGMHLNWEFHLPAETEPVNEFETPGGLSLLTHIRGLSLLTHIL
jgi:hypothetical protein